MDAFRLSKALRREGEKICLSFLRGSLSSTEMDANSDITVEDRHSFYIASSTKFVRPSSFDQVLPSCQFKRGASLVVLERALHTVRSLLRLNETRFTLFGCSANRPSRRYPFRCPNCRRPLPERKCLYLRFIKHSIHCRKKGSPVNVPQLPAMGLGIRLA
jgi:hypothetical protein